MSLLPLVALLAAPALAGDDLPPEAVAVWEAMSQVRSLEARFEQQRTTSLLNQPLVSTGTLRFERPDKLAWVVEQPGRSTMVVSGSRVGMSYPDLGVHDQLDLAGDPDAQRLVRSMMVWLAGDLEQVSRDYGVAWAAAPAGGPDGALHLATLTPLDPTMAALVARLELSIGGAPLRVLAVTMHEPDGDRVDIAMREVRLDPELPDDAFSIAGN
jgi:outer membrane lipoprotein-sorting protein